MHPALRLARPLACSLFFAAAVAAPSGGPYGPIDQVYQIPKAPHVYFVAPDGDASAPGTSLKQPTTIEAAVARAVTGDAIVLRGGVYRTGSLTFNQRIVFQPYAGERPILKGTEVATNWEPAGTNVWKTRWTKLFPAKPLAWWNRAREEAKTPLHRFNNDMVFVDGAFLRSVGSMTELDANSYYIDYDKGEVYVGVNPASRLVEITAHDGALIRTSLPVNGKVSDKKGPVIRGLTLTQYARRCIEVEGKKQFGPNDEPTDEPVGPSDPSTFGKEAVGTLLENVTISYCSRVAGWFRGDRLVIRNSLVSDTGTEGIYVIGSSDVVVEKNIIRHVNNLEQLTGYYASAVKIFNQTRRVTFRDNLVIDNPNANGVWYDVGNREGVVVNNYVEGSPVGFFFEISDGVTVAGNVFVRNGRGVWILNSANARIYNNTFYDNPATISRNERSATGDLFDWHPATGPGLEAREGHLLVNNLLVASTAYRGPLLRIDQPEALCTRVSRAQAKTIDANVYVRASGASPLAVIGPSNAPGCNVSLASLKELRQFAPQYERKARQFDRLPQAVFRSADFARYELRLPIPAATPTPADVVKMIGSKIRTAGAYPFRK